MGTESQYAKLRSQPTGAAFDNARIGTSSRSAELLAPRHPITSGLGRAGGDEPEIVKNARTALAAVLEDDRRLLEVVKLIIEQARTSDPRTAMQLLDLVSPVARRWPGVARLVADTHTGVEARAEQAKDREAALEKAEAAREANEAWKSEEWVKGTFSSANFQGHQVRMETPLTKQQLYEAFSTVAPHLSHDLKVMMIGQVWTEQAGTGIYNFNFGGVEGGSKAFTTDVWTTAAISVATYNAQPEPKSAKYRDWTKGNPFGGVWGPPGHKETPRGTIQYQLDHHEDPIIVMTPKPRPAYENVNHAAAAFVQMLEKRIKTLQQSRDPAHRKLAEDAMSGNIQAYAELVNMVDTHDADENGKALPGFGAWNGSAGYTGRAVTSIQQTQRDLADVESSK